MANNNEASGVSKPETPYSRYKDSEALEHYFADHQYKLFTPRLIPAEPLPPRPIAKPKVKVPPPKVTPRPTKQAHLHPKPQRTTVRPQAKRIQKTTRPISQKQPVSKPKSLMPGTKVSRGKYSVPIALFFAVCLTAMMSIIAKTISLCVWDLSNNPTLLKRNGPLLLGEIVAFVVIILLGFKAV